MQGWNEVRRATCVAVAYGWIGLSAACAAPAPPQEQLGNITYTAPAGWQAGAPNETTRTFQTKAGDAQALIILMRGPEFQGDFKAAFEAAVKAAQAGNTVVQQSTVNEARTDAGYSVLSQAVVFDDKNGQHGWGEYVAADPNRRLVFLGYVATTQELFTQDMPVLQRFVKDLNFTDLAAVPLANPLAAPGARQTEAPPANAAGDTAAETLIELGHGTSGVWSKTAAQIYADEQTRRVPGQVTGRIYDAQGRPFHLPNCRVLIHVWGVTANGDRTFFDGEADANGRYEVPVVHGLYAVNCTAKMPLGGQVLSVALEVLDGHRPSVKEDSTPGIVKDFGLKLTGPVFDGRPGDTHGGSLTVTDGPGYHSLFDAMSRRYPAGTTVQILLIPRGSFIDGSPAKPIRYDCDLTKMQTGQTLTDFPLALYTVAARLMVPGATPKPIKVGGFPGERYGDTVDIAYVPEPTLDGRPSVPNICVTDQ